MTAAARASAPDEQLFLAALWLCLPSTDTFTLDAPPVSIKSIHDKMLQITRQLGIASTPSLEDSLEIAQDLSFANVLEMQYLHERGRAVITLQASRDDIRYALRTDPVLGRLVEGTE